MSTSNAINTNCVLRRNLRRQPYGRCSVCTLHLRGCHAWQASRLSFGILVLTLSSTVVVPGWPIRAIALAIIALVIAEGRASHRRTDQLIDSEHRLREQNSRLESAIEAATRGLSEANRALATSNLELIETDRLREDFVANVAHDLRTPLTAVKGAAENLLDGIAGPLAPDQREYVEIVRDHAGRLASNLNDLLQAARLRSAPVELKSEALDLGGLVEEVVRGLEPLAREKALRVTVRLDDVRASGDREKLRRALENLISNAIKFTHAGGSVAIDVSSSSEGFEIAVTDTGEGIPANELPLLFERFYRGSASQSGTGLGLSIARNLARLHGGDIRVSSVVGVGSEFRLMLPVAPRARVSLPILGTA